MTQEELDAIWKRPERQHRRPDNNMFMVRNVLNIVFMLSVVGAIALYMTTPATLLFGYPLWGLVVGLAILIKPIEVSLRIIFR